MTEKVNLGDMNKGFDWSVSFLRWLQKERNQLYGTLAIMMLDFGIGDIDISEEDFKSIEGYWVQFVDSGDENTVRVHLHREKAEEEDNEL